MKLKEPVSYVLKTFVQATLKISNDNFVDSLLRLLGPPLQLQDAILLKFT